MVLPIGKDRATGLIVICLGILIILFSLQLPPSRVAGDIGPVVFPIIAAVILLINGTILIVKDKEKPKEKKAFFSKEEWKRFGVLLSNYMGYFFLLWLTGFIPATFIAMYVMCSMFSTGKKVAIWKRALFAAIVTIIIYWAFWKGLGMRLPVGELIRIDL